MILFYVPSFTLANILCAKICNDNINTFYVGIPIWWKLYPSKILRIRSNRNKDSNGNRLGFSLHSVPYPIQKWQMAEKQSTIYQGYLKSR